MWAFQGYRKAFGYFFLVLVHILFGDRWHRLYTRSFIYGGLCDHTSALLQDVFHKDYFFMKLLFVVIQTSLLSAYAVPAD